MDNRQVGPRKRLGQGSGASSQRRLGQKSAPRPTLTIIDSRSIKVPDDAVRIWAINKSAELARAELYFTHALESGRTGFLDLARDVALEAVGHLTMEDPRLHLLLGQVALGLGDRRLLGEAKAFLDFFNFERWRRKLGQVEESGALDFADP